LKLGMTRICRYAKIWQKLHIIGVKKYYLPIFNRNPKKSLLYMKMKMYQVNIFLNYQKKLFNQPIKQIKIITMKDIK
jgi:hypothetical protein